MLLVAATSQKAREDVVWLTACGAGVLRTAQLVHGRVHVVAHVQVGAIFG